jgi:hypothetical protein
VNFSSAFAADYGNDLLLIAIGVSGSIWILAWQSLAVWLYVTTGLPA